MIDEATIVSSLKRDLTSGGRFSRQTTKGILTPSFSTLMTMSRRARSISAALEGSNAREGAPVIPVEDSHPDGCRGLLLTEGSVDGRLDVCCFE